MLSENPRDGRESWQIFRPWKILAIPPFSCQATTIITSLAPILEFQYIYDACGVLETTDKATTRTPEQSSRRTAKLSSVSCLGNNLLLLGVVHYFKEWVSWLPPEGEERLRLSHKYPLQIYAYWKTSDDEVTTRCFSTWFDPSRTLTNNKGSTTQRHRQDENLTILDRVHILIRSRSRIQWAGFSREGHGTQMQKMHGHSKPQVFSGGHMDPAQP